MGVHTFPKGICPKVNVIARLEYELTYYDSAVQRFNHLHHEDTPYLQFDIFEFFIIITNICNYILARKLVVLGNDTRNYITVFNNFFH